jgi:hypothetical protein
LRAVPEVIGAGETVAINLGFEDLGKQQNVQHVTFRMEVSKDGKGIFSDFFHGHTGEVKLQFRSSNASPTVNGNFDTLSGAWVGDPGTPIVVNGKVFSDPGAYRTLVEVTGIDNDKTDLPEPLTYEFNIVVFVDQSFEVSYRDMKFNVKTVSPVQISQADFMQEKKQLVLTSVEMINATSEDFSIRVDVPTDMMSSPFTAALDDGTDLGIAENATDSSVNSLIITGKKHDAGVDMQGMSNGTLHRHSIVISATNVVPEFPIGIASATAALAITLVILIAKRRPFVSAGKTY